MCALLTLPQLVDGVALASVHVLALGVVRINIGNRPTRRSQAVSLSLVLSQLAESWTTQPHQRPGMSGSLEERTTRKRCDVRTFQLTWPQQLFAGGSCTKCGANPSWQVAVSSVMNCTSHTARWMADTSYPWLPLLTDDFSAAVASLPTLYDASSYAGFVRKFGTFC